MSDITKKIFNPAKQAQGPWGQLGSYKGKQGGQFGHLGTKYGDLGGSQIKFNSDDHFDVNSYYKPGNHYDPEKLIKRY